MPPRSPSAFPARAGLPAAALTLLVTSLATLAASSALAAEPYSLELSRKLVGLSSPRVSPDGKSVAFLVSRPDFELNHNDVELWLADVATGQARPVTFERRSVSSPQWSPDGSTIAFLAEGADEKKQVWLLPMRAGEPRRLTKAAMGVDHFAWRPDGGAIAFATADTLPVRTGEAKFVGAFRVEDEDLFLKREITPWHLWVQELEGPARRLTSGTWSLEFSLPPGSPPSRPSWSPDGKRIAIARVPAPQSGRLDSVSIVVV